MFDFIGRVIASHGAWCLVMSERGDQLFPLSGNLKMTPVVGDFVMVRDGAIQEVQPRRSSISRMAPGGRRDVQVLAANIDLLFIVCGLDGDFNLRRLERFLVLAIESGAAPVFVLTKSDVAADLAGTIAAARTISGDFPILTSTFRDRTGAEQVRSMIPPDKTAALIGSSGAGKSTLLNMLLGEDRQATAEVRASDSRGRHTTTNRQMFRIPGGGWLVDQPGIREIQIHADKAAVADAFGDVEALATSCRFRDCRHEQEPGCAVRDGVAPERLKSFHKLRREAERFEQADDPLKESQRKQWIKRLCKNQKRFYEND